MNFTAILGFVKAIWPIISMLVGAFLSTHATAAFKDAHVPSPTAAAIADQPVHVLGAGGVGISMLLAGATGGVVNHYRGKATAVADVKAAEKIPSVPPPGVSEVLHREDELHSAMLADPLTTAGELDKLNELIKLRKPGTLRLAQQTTTTGTAP